MQRLFVMQVTRKSENGEDINDGMVVNDWVDVQNDQYRYIAIDDMGTVIIRIVISEYYACEVGWEY
jgi:hypothetical protein